MQRKQHAELFADLSFRHVDHFVRCKYVAIRPDLGMGACYGLARAVGVYEYVMQTYYDVIAHKQPLKLVYGLLIRCSAKQGTYGILYYANA